MAEQQAAGTRLQYYCEKKDAIPIKNGLVSLKHRFEKVTSRSAERTKVIWSGFRLKQITRCLLADDFQNTTVSIGISTSNV